MEGFALQSGIQASSVQQSAVQASGVEFENWMLQQRQRLGRIHRRLLTVLVEGHAAHSAWSEAIRYGEQLAAIDPLDESNHRSLLQLYSASGQRHALVEHFERMRGLLKEELGVEPLPETVELYQSLVARSGARPPNRSLKQNEAPKQAWRLRTTISLPMIGRDAELAQISAWLNEAMAGKLSVICVQGVAGSGKTRLLHEATAHFHYPVWLGSGQQVAQTTPYLAILRALRSGLAAFDPALLTQALRALPDLWLAEASRLLPELRDLRPDLRLPPTLPVEQAQARLFEALTAGSGLAQAGAFLVVDDLHDADSESFDWLLNLAHHLQNQRTLWQSQSPLIAM